MPRATARDGPTPRPALAPWTASRCNRILRQLTSFVSRLEKWHREFLAAQEEDETDHVSPDNVGTESQPDDDSQPDWLAHNTSRQGPKGKKYTTRRKTAPQTPRVRGPGATARTPHDPAIILMPDATETGDVFRDRDSSDHNGTRKPNLALTSSSSQSAPYSAQNSRSWTARTMHLAQDYDKIIRDGLTIIPAFLAATSDPDRPTELGHSNSDKGRNTGRGARPLLDMCLAAVSQDMVQQQKHSDATKNGYDGQYDLVGSHLQELEDYFGDSKTGWPQLRTLARACGISLVTRLIRNGALPEDTALHLITSYNHSLADFTQAVKEALVEVRLDTLDPASGFQDLPEIGTLGTYSEDVCRLSKSGRYQVSVEWAKRALAREDNPITLLSRFVKWKHLFTLIVISKHNAQFGETYACGLLEEVYCQALCCGRREASNGRQDATTVSVLESRSKLSWAEHPKSNDPLWKRLKMAMYLMLSSSLGARNRALPDLIGRISKKAQILAEHDRECKLSEQQQCLMAQIFFTNICQLLTCGRGVHHDLLESFEDLLCTMQSRRLVPGHLVGAILSMPLGWNDFQQLIQQLSSVPCGKCVTLRLLLAKVSADAAMDYAVDHSENSDLWPWALEIHEAAQEKVQLGAGPLATPSLKNARKGYRWDESMEEWIMKTPQMVPKVQGERHESASCEELLPITQDVGTEVDQRIQLHPQRQPTGRPLPTNNSTLSGNGLKRKGLRDGFEVYTDGDFEYKKPRRNMLPEEPSLSTLTEIPAILQCHKHYRGDRYLEEGSEDELSLMEC